MLSKGVRKLDPEADLSTIQLVSPHTSKEELQSLYLQVYKQQRLLGSLPGEPELMEEVETKEGTRDSINIPADRHLTPRDQTSERERRGSSIAHQKALAMAAALEEKIERLSFSHTRSQPKVRTHSQSRDHWTHGSGGWKRRCCQMQPESAWPPTLNIILPGGIWGLAERQWLPKTMTWRSH